MAETAKVETAKVDKDNVKPRPEKPDDEKYKKDLSIAEKALKESQDKFNAIKAKLDGVKPSNKDSPAAKKQTELRSELASIRQQQSGFKSSRNTVQEKVASLDAQFKSRVAEQKANRARIPFKNVEEVDSRISKLDKEVESGLMKLVDEKKALAEISSLRKLRKNFAGFEDADKGINDIKNQISELRKSQDNPEAKALSDRYNAITKELDEIKASQDEIYKNLNSLRDERTKLHEDQQTKYTAVKTLKDNYYGQKKAHHAHQQEVFKAQQERRKAENDAYAKQKRQAIARERLEEASGPAYMDEIITAEGLIHYFDPSSAPPSKPLRGPSGFAAEASRTVNSSDIKGTALSKKEDRDDTYFMGTGGKKGKKGRKGTDSPAPATPTEGKFQLNIGILESFGKINVEAPTKQADVPEILEKLKAEVAKWKAESPEKTKENIAKAQAEIDRLEADAANGASEGNHDTAKKSTMAKSGVNGKPAAQSETAQEDDAVKETTNKLNDAKIEDNA